MTDRSEFRRTRRPPLDFVTFVVASLVLDGVCEALVQTDSTPIYLQQNSLSFNNIHMILRIYKEEIT